MFEWLKDNASWIFSGVGISAISGIAWVLRRGARESQPSGPSIQVNNTINSALLPPENGVSPPSDPDAESRKQNIRILFIDDDTTFKVVKIIRRAGWPYTKVVKDIKSLEAPEVVEAHILFVDIQGVGKALQFSNEGLGLALALKNKHPDKKVVIYSAQTSGDRFDEALRRADDFLPKNADPYQFIRLVEELSRSK